jgi:hypothetical protein
VKLAGQEAGRVSVRAEQEYRQAILADSPPQSDDVANAWSLRVLPMPRADARVEQIAALSTTTWATLLASGVRVLPQ